MPRWAASGCQAGENIFVIGGFGNNEIMINTIEKTNYAGLVRGEAVWQLIKPSRHNFIPRAMTAVGPVNSEEIAILGGYTNLTEKSNEIYIFNTRTGRIKQIKNENPGKFITF